LKFDEYVELLSACISSTSNSKCSITCS
jgi:hypothetical protein